VRWRQDYSPEPEEEEEEEEIPTHNIDIGARLIIIQRFNALQLAARSPLGEEDLGDRRGVKEESQTIPKEQPNKSYEYHSKSGLETMT
jgi:hypothetical protein